MLHLAAGSLIVKHFESAEALGEVTSIWATGLASSASLKSKLGIFTKIFTVFGHVSLSFAYITTALGFTIFLNGKTISSCSSSSLSKCAIPPLGAERIEDKGCALEAFRHAAFVLSTISIIDPSFISLCFPSSTTGAFFSAVFSFLSPLLPLPMTFLIVFPTPAARFSQLGTDPQPSLFEKASEKWLQFLPVISYVLFRHSIFISLIVDSISALDWSVRPRAKVSLYFHGDDSGIHFGRWVKIPVERPAPPPPNTYSVP
mmetsp:Transcript_4758/g.11241  ORF Transcript_4758/g.11241 Transcript_4758/m.11241 type:complete len:259 (+) Transcript_4758:247-1023(+)